jgi:hypothetical protein
MVRRDVVRNEVDDQLQAPAGQRVSCRRKPGRAAEPRVDLVGGNAVGRTDHVRRLEVGERGVEVGEM